MTNDNLVQKAVAYGGKLAPLVISEGLTSGTGLMNPSVFVNDKNEILVNLRHVNYTLYHSENDQQFPSRWGPLSYLHPEQDQALRTTNYICQLDENLSIIGSRVVDTSKLDVEPLWEFTGEEDCRLVQWEGKYYNIGVRRDTTTHGEGRMELSEIKFDKRTGSAKEVSRLRIPTPGDNTSYCEKNWMPILDKPFHFVKWTSPTEVVRTWPNEPARCEQVSLTPGLIPPKDQRGGSQVVRWGNVYIAITHEVDLFKNYLDQKDGIYRHRLVVWDEQFNLIGLSPDPITFLEGRVEFVAGAAKYNEDLLISFGFQDNAAFILRTPKVVVEDLILEALTYEF
jgi:predicted GH43/DUF377 family glycosyl hydrolase